MPETYDDPMAAIDAHLQGPPAAALPPPDAPPGEAPPEVANAIDAHLQPPEDPLLNALFALIQQKYGVLLAYIAYGDQLATVTRDGLAKHLHDHVEEELAWIYQLNRLLASLGAPHFPAPPPVPEVPLGTERPALEALAAMEGALVAAWEACEQAAEMTPRAPGVAYGLRALFQEGARVDAAHAQDMRRYLGSTP